MNMIVKRHAKRFTLIELLIVVAVIAILLALLLPMLARAKQKALMVVCVNNLRQVGIGLTLYTSDSNGWFPIRTGNNAANVHKSFPWILKSKKDSDDFDDRPHLKAYLDSAILDCPLLPSLDSDRYDANDVVVGSAYAIFAGWKARNSDPKHYRLRKLGEVMTHGPNQFDVLASDRHFVYRWKDYRVFSNHRDSEDFLELLPDKTSLKNGVGGNYSIYMRYGAPQYRGRIAANYIAGDGSVYTLRSLVLGDPRLGKIPVKAHCSVSSNLFIEVPLQEATP